MFDSMNLEQAISDLYDGGVEANENVHMAVKTSNGLTERQILKDIVLQGNTFGSIFASVQVDSIEKECQEAGYGYQ